MNFNFFVSFLARWTSTSIRCWLAASHRLIPFWSDPVKCTRMISSDACIACRWMGELWTWAARLSRAVCRRLAIATITVGRVRKDTPTIQLCRFADLSADAWIDGTRRCVSAVEVFCRPTVTLRSIRYLWSKADSSSSKYLRSIGECNCSRTSTAARPSGTSTSAGKSDSQSKPITFRALRKSSIHQNRWACASER